MNIFKGNCEDIKTMKLVEIEDRHCLGIETEKYKKNKSTDALVCKNVVTTKEQIENKSRD